MSGVRRYRRRHAEVDAIRYDGTNDDEVLAFLAEAGVEHVERYKLPGLSEGYIVDEGDWHFRVGDYIVDNRGYVERFTPDRFAEEYEPAVVDARLTVPGE